MNSGNSGNADDFAGAGVDPAGWSNQQLQLDRTVGVQTDIDGVFQWNDQSGQASNYTEASGPLKPAEDADGVTSDGDDDEMTGPNSSDLWSSSFTIVIAFRQHTCATDFAGANAFQNEHVFGSVGSRIGVYCRSSGRAGMLLGFDGYDVDGGLSFPGWVILGARYDGADLKLRVNGSAWASFAIVETANLVATKLFRSGNPSSHSDASAAFLVLTDDEKTEAEVDAAIAYYNAILEAF